MDKPNHILYCYLQDDTVADLITATEHRVFSVRDVVIKLAEPNSYRAIIVKSISMVADAISLLKLVRRRYPELARIIITGDISAADRYAVAAVAHACLPEHSKPSDLRKALDRSIKTEELVHNPELKRFTQQLKRLPAMPAIVTELTAALESKTASVHEITSIIMQSPGIAAKVMQLVNSAYFGVRNAGSITLEGAVNLIGERELRDLVITAQLFNLVPDNKHWQQFSAAKIQERSAFVSQLAAKIAKAAGASKDVISQSRLAGLLVDVGMLVLACENSERYTKIIDKAVVLKQPVYAVEKLELNTTHAHIGAALLDAWYLSPEIVHAVLFHHTPAGSGDDEFSVLTAVHVADSLIPQVPVKSTHRAPSMDYLRAIGCSEQLAEWKKLAINID